MPVDFKSIKLLLLDVDGVMTDGCIIYDNNGGETKAFGRESNPATSTVLSSEALFLFVFLR